MGQGAIFASRPPPKLLLNALSIRAPRTSTMSYIGVYIHKHTPIWRGMVNPSLKPKRSRISSIGITDSSLQPVKYTIAGFTHLMQNFHEAANYIGNIIDLNKKSDFNAQNVSSTTTSRGGRGGRGRGNKGKGREGGRGGCGRGRGRGRGGRSNSGSSNPRRWISSKEWNNMPDNEKETLCNAHAQHAKRNIGAAGTRNDDDSAQEDTPNAQGSPSKRQHLDVSNAGDHMSRGGWSYISQIRSG
jgi:hypothetical protein